MKIMDSEKMFLNKRYVTGANNALKRYFLRNGVIKQYVATPLARKTIRDEDIWYDLEDLPLDMQEKYRDMAISASDLSKTSRASNSKKQNIFDSEEVLIYVTPNTPILPVVGNILPSDGTNAYTVIMKDGTLKLKPILICWNCHWSELFTGATTYKNNVFCLASELSPEQRQQYLDEIILLKDVPGFLAQFETESIEKEKGKTM